MDNGWSLSLTSYFPAWIEAVEVVEALVQIGMSPLGGTLLPDPMPSLKANDGKEAVRKRDTKGEERGWGGSACRAQVHVCCRSCCCQWKHAVGSWGGGRSPQAKWAGAKLHRRNSLVFSVDLVRLGSAGH